MKKLVLLMTVLAMLLSTLTVPAMAETTTIEWFIDYSALPSNWNMDEPIFAGITEATGIQCTFNIPAEDPDTKLNLLMISGKMPDLITSGNWDLRAEMIETGMIWDMEELLTKYVPDSHLLTSFPEDIKKAIIARDGGWYVYPSHMVSDDLQAIYGYPTEEIGKYYTASKYESSPGIYLRKQYVDQLGIDVDAIKTEQDLLNVLEQFEQAGLSNDNGASVYTLMTSGTNTDIYTLNSPLAWTFGAMPLDENGQYQSLYFSEQYREAVAFLNKCAQKGWLTETQLIMDEPTLVSVANSGRVACFIGHMSTLGSAADQMDVWVSPGAIVADEGYTPVMPYNSNVGTGWLSTMVAKSSKNAEACARFIDYMSSPEGLLLHMYGVEGTDYYFDEAGCLHRTETGAAKIEDGVTGVFGFYAFHDTSFQRSVEYKEVGKLNPTMAYCSEENVVIYDSSIFDMPSGYVPAGSDMAFTSTEISNYAKANLSKVILAADDASFNAGYDAFLAELTKLGIKDYYAFLNEQVQKQAAEKGVELKPVN